MILQGDFGSGGRAGHEVHCRGFGKTSSPETPKLLLDLVVLSVQFTSSYSRVGLKLGTTPNTGRFLRLSQGVTPELDSGIVWNWLKRIFLGTGLGSEHPGPTVPEMTWRLVATAINHSIPMCISLTGGAHRLVDWVPFLLLWCAVCTHRGFQGMGLVSHGSVQPWLIPRVWIRSIIVARWFSAPVFLFTDHVVQYAIISTPIYNGPVSSYNQISLNHWVWVLQIGPLETSRWRSKSRSPHPLPVCCVFGQDTSPTLAHMVVGWWSVWQG